MKRECLCALVVLLAAMAGGAGPPDRREGLLADFAAARDVRTKLAMLPKVVAACGEADLPPEARYLLALTLLEKHLTWHVPPARKVDEEMKELRRTGGLARQAQNSRWADAHTGEPWMIERLDQGERDRLRGACLAFARSMDLAPGTAVGLYWRLREPAHADVARAVELLKRVDRDSLGRKARRWIEEIRRNNTVVTFDMPGDLLPDADGPVVMDVRNADEVRLRLYRVRGPADLVAVADRIGEDFIYRDYGLQGPPRARPDEIRHVDVLQEMSLAMRSDEAERPALPRFGKEDLAAEWSVGVGELKPAPIHRRLWEQWRWRDDEGENDPEGWYFDDACRRHHERLWKEYRPRDWAPTAWVCERLVTIPKAALARGGAYVLLAEANGQKAYAPIVVDPLGLTMRRCRDGVFVLVSSVDGLRPVAGAAVHAWGMVGSAVTDEQGAAFARVFARGDRAIVVAKDGRYAIGGFGRVFEGLYVSQRDLERGPALMLRQARLMRALVERSPRIYADRHVLAAYTDRPTYRPGQQVQLKLIARRLPLEQAPPPRGPGRRFRQEDFEVSSRLELLPAGTQIHYEAIDPRGRVIGGGAAALNDYGTAVGQVRLFDEALLGVYSLRVHVAGRPRVLPGVFAVASYRRPDFEIALTGVGEKVSAPTTLKVRLTGAYYFGKPVAGGKAQVRLVRTDHYRPLSEAVGVTDGAGCCELSLDVPAGLSGGPCAVVATLTGDGGRVVSKAVACRVEPSGVEANVRRLGDLPRFVPASQPLDVVTPAKAVVAQTRRFRHSGDVEIEEKLTFRTSLGGSRPLRSARLTLTEPGWYTLTAGDERAELFVYGGSADPRNLPGGTGWVDLTRYAGERGGEETDRWDWLWDRPEHEVLALFDRQHAEVGGRLKLLVYAPGGGRLLLTMEGRTVADYCILSLDETKGAYYHVVEVPITRRLLPNFYLRGRIVVRPAVLHERLNHPRQDTIRQEEAVRLEENETAGEDPRWCRVDVIDPAVPASAEKLKVAVEPDREAYRPGDTVNVALRVADVAGRPSQAEVSLAAVDESVYAFGADNVGSLAEAFSDPHPPRRYLPKTWRTTRPTRGRGLHQLAAMQRAMEQLAQAAAMDTVRQALDAAPSVLAMGDARRVPLSALGELPAGALPEARLRGDFRETAAWQPQLRTGPDGLARTSFALPDSLTGYRLTAVALTKATEIGTARATVRTELPLSVRVFLPRFAVEKDRLLAVGVIRNHTDRPRTCDAAWKVEGAKVEGPTAAGRVTVPAGGSVRAALWFVADRAGVAEFTFRAGDAEDADAERRLLPVRPLGRRREVALTGRFDGRKLIDLPAGFVAQELTVTVARSEAAEAMEGLGYLVDYPYGCVEQTMSRFLPAVMVKHAVREAAAELPADVAARLPDVLAKGLKRLYGFQQPDGGWGWWQNDASRGEMTAYVVYGLARCRQTGAAVDADSLRRGCERLKRWLATGRAKGPREGLVWLALSLAGRADAGELAAAARDALGGDASPDVRCSLALACREASLADLAGRLWAAVSDWQPTATRDIALKLRAQVAFGAPAGQCDESARKLLALRAGHRWPNTWETSWALEALAEALARVQAAAPAKAVRIAINGRAVLNAAGPEELSRLVHRAKVGLDVLAGREAPAVELLVEGAESPTFAITAVGVQRQDVVEPIGTDVKVRRRYTTPDGRPLDGPLNVGDVVAVHVTVELARPMSYFQIVDHRPAGFEFAGERLLGPDATSAARVEFRDETICVFHTDLPAGPHEIVYHLRAETPGLSHVLPGRALPMYDEKSLGETGAARLEVCQPPPG